MFTVDVASKNHLGTIEMKSYSSEVLLDLKITLIILKNTINQKEKYYQ